MDPAELTAEERLARKAYQAYSRATGNKNKNGERMPKWEDLPPETQFAWMQAAKEVVFWATMGLE